MTQPVSESLPEHPALTTVPGNGELEIVGRLVEASNATFLARLTTEDGQIDCVYKPIRGERPLWDFPRHTLGLREVAAYELSRVAGFDVVPVTVLTDGPFGTGSLQIWVDTVEADNESLVDLVPTRTLPRPGWFACVDGFDGDEQSVSVIHADNAALRRLAVFDCLANNADRKGGHILSSGGRVFGVDHGICFHVETKLRTLLWGWAGSELTDGERALVARARDEGPAALEPLLAEDEIEATVRRAEVLLRRGTLPRARGEWPSIPWPPF
ncbi:MAG TPA: SCO1664 family protein [Microlunatus sp.]|nr:SCO1664 family protein [Microlunatus sp.]